MIFRIFQPNPAAEFFIAIMIVIENRFRINQILIFIFQSNPAEKNFSRLWLNFFCRTLMKKWVQRSAHRCGITKASDADPVTFLQPDSD